MVMQIEHPQLDDMKAELERIGVLEADVSGTPFFNYFALRDFSRGGRDPIDRLSSLKKYAYTIPSLGTLEMLRDTVASKSIVSVGAGTGYVENLLAQIGFAVYAYDESPYVNKYFQHERNDYYPVHEAPATVSSQHPDSALLLCWSPFDNSMAYDALEAYKGDEVIYIGEAGGGCTGSYEFHCALMWSDEWGRVEERCNEYSFTVCESVEIYRRVAGDKAGE